MAERMMHATTACIYVTGSTSSITTSGMFTPTGSTGSTWSVFRPTQTASATMDDLAHVRLIPVPLRELMPGNEYELPDGSKLKLDAMGNYQLLDQHAKVIYRANRVRAFNPFINASDLLEQFIDALGDRVTQDQVLTLPIETFINWLILQAAKQDGEPTDQLPTVEAALPGRSPQARPRCLVCGRFLARSWSAARIEFCSPEHMERRLRALRETNKGGADGYIRSLPRRSPQVAREDATDGSSRSISGLAATGTLSG